MILPDKNAKTYESVRCQVKDQLKRGHRPARATFEVENDLGGLGEITNVASLPKRRHA